MSQDLRHRRNLSRQDISYGNDIVVVGGHGSNVEAEKPPPPDARGRWKLRMTSVFLTLLGIRVLSAILLPIQDCDEVFNYWEPTHYLSFGSGLQTWEYSPQFALRSYLYILPHVGLVKLGSALSFMLNADKIFVFFIVRMSLGLVTAASETWFIHGVERMFSRSVALYTYFFLLSSAGMFLSGTIASACTAFLPSTMAMVGVFLSYGGFMSQYYFVAVLGGDITTFFDITCVHRGCYPHICALRFAAHLTPHDLPTPAVATIFSGWPFSGVVFVPMALAVFGKCGLRRPVIYGVVVVGMVGVPCVLVDLYFYRKLMFVPWNIIRYNVLDDNAGPTLYGVEPWWFYFLNMFLNFNVVLPMAFIALPLALRFRKWSVNLQHLSRVDLLTLLGPFFTWFALMSRMPHKEERFMYVIYPFVCLGGAISLALVLDIINVIFGALFPANEGIRKRRLPQRLTTLLAMILCVVVFGVAASRVGSLTLGYTAPMRAYEHLARRELPHMYGSAAFRADDNETVNICAGKEWYRFPSSFFIPDTPSRTYHFAFLKSDFDGQLPQPYVKGPSGTSDIQEGFNDMNEEDLSRYLDEAECHYIVDLDFPGQGEKHYMGSEPWEVAAEFPFMDKAHSMALFRAFFIPFFSTNPSYVRWNKYFVLRNTNLVNYR